MDLTAAGDDVQGDPVAQSPISRWLWLGLVALVSIGVVVRTQVAREQEATRIEGLVGRLVSAEPNQLPDIVKELDANPEVASTYLSPLVLPPMPRRSTRKRAQLHARLALVSRDRALVEPLLEELLTNKVAYVGPIRQQLRPYAGELTEKLRAILRDEKAEARSPLPRRGGAGGLRSRIRGGLVDRAGLEVRGRATGLVQCRVPAAAPRRAASDSCATARRIWSGSLPMPRRPTLSS